MLMPPPRVTVSLTRVGGVQGEHRGSISDGFKVEAGVPLGEFQGDAPAEAMANDPSDLRVGQQGRLGVSVALGVPRVTPEGDLRNVVPDVLQVAAC